MLTLVRIGVIKRKKKNRVARLFERRRFLPANAAKNGLSKTPPFAAFASLETIQAFKEDKLAAFRIRSQQMKEIVGDEISEAEKKMNRRFAIASANVTLAGISLLYHPLIWLTVPIAIYSTIPFGRLAYKAAIEERRVSSYLLEMALRTGMLFGGYFYALTIGVWLATLGQKLLLLSENNSKRNLDIGAAHNR